MRIVKITNKKLAKGILNNSFTCRDVVHAEASPNAPLHIWVTEPVKDLSDLPKARVLVGRQVFHHGEKTSRVWLPYRNSEKGGRAIPVAVICNHSNPNDVVVYIGDAGQRPEALVEQIERGLAKAT